MKKTYCDVCGKEIKAAVSYAQRRVSRQITTGENVEIDVDLLIQIETFIAGAGMKKPDLCPTCLRSIVTEAVSEDERRTDAFPDQLHTYIKEADDDSQS